MLASITVFIYFAFSCGVLVNTHFCMDEYASSHFYQQADDVCDRCGMDNEGSGCCRDEVTIVKLDQDQQSIQIIASIEPPDIPVSILTEYQVKTAEEEVFSREYLSHSPPLITSDRPVLHSVFRI